MHWRSRHKQLIQGLAFFGMCLWLLGAALPSSWAVEPHSLVLGQGRLNGFKWRVGIEHGGGKAHLACLDLDVVPLGQDEESPPFQVCTSVLAPAKIITYEVERAGKSLTLLAGHLSPRVVRLEFWTQDGTKLVPKVRRLSARAGQRIGLPRLQYIRLALPERFCYRQVRGFDERGGVVYRGASVC